MKNLILSLFFLVGSILFVSAQNVKTVTIHTSAQCGMCKETIETALYKVKGVVSASVELETKNVTITYRTKKLTNDDLKKAITMAGYDADELPADTNSYNNLPECCKKGGMDHH